MERIDDLQFGGFRLVQDTDLYCFSTDAVLLADFARIPRGAHVVDLGAGSGILDVLMYSRQPEAFYAAIELQEPLFALLKRNLALNGMDGLSRAVLGDIKNAPGIFGPDNDVCVCNPPFEKVGSGDVRRAPTQDIARKEIAVTFAEICNAAASCLRWGGRFYLIHRTQRLAEVLCTMRSAGIEPKLLRLCAGAPHKEPRQCLIMGQRGAKEGMRCLPTLIATDEHGHETPEIRRIYRREEDRS